MRLRSPPRWANWLRGVRTRSLRAGLVGGLRPFYLIERATIAPCEDKRTPKQFQLYNPHLIAGDGWSRLLPELLQLRRLQAMN